MQFINDPAFWNTVRVSAIYTVATVVVELLLGLGIALLLRERTRFNNFCSVALLLPLMCAPVLAALMWKLMTDSNFGVLSWALGQLGIDNHALGIGQPYRNVHRGADRRLGLHAVHDGAAAGGLRSLPQQPFEAARLDGVPATFVFFRITLPMLTPYLITAALFRLLDSIQQFDIVYAMTQGGPGDNLMLFQVRAYLSSSPTRTWRMPLR